MAKCLTKQFCRETEAMCRFSEFYLYIIIYIYLYKLEVTNGYLYKYIEKLKMMHQFPVHNSVGCSSDKSLFNIKVDCIFAYICIYIYIYI